MPKKKELTFPHVLKGRNGQVKIYKCKSGPSWTTYTLSYHAGKRVRESRSSFPEALKRGQEIIEDFEHGRIQAKKSDWREWVRYQTLEEKLEGRSLEDAVAFFLNHNKQKIPTMTLTESLDEFLAFKARTTSLDNSGTLKTHFNSFKKKISKPLHLITTKDLDDYLKEIAVARSRHNHRTSICALFNWAKSKGYLSKTEDTAADGTEVPNWKAEAKAKASNEVWSDVLYTPEEIEKILRTLDKTDGGKQVLPFVAIGAFVGVRSEEIQRIQWSDILWDEQEIVLQWDKTKTGARRQAIIPDNAMTWLLPYKDHVGKVCPGSPYYQLEEARTANGIPSKYNAMRHGYISYAMKIYRNAAEVAEQCGNSEDQVQKTYKALVPKPVAEKWFKIVR